MGLKLFGVDVAQVVADAMPASSMPSSFILRKIPTEANTAGSLTGENLTTPVDYNCHGAIVDYTQSEFEESQQIKRSDRKIVIIALPLTNAGVAPEKDDRIVDGSRVYVVIHVRSDAMVAHYECQCR